MRFKTDAEALVLGALAGGPQHGYAIVKILRDGSSGLFNMNEGQLYPLLHSMQKKGWIKGEWETSESGPARKTYVLLEAGFKELGKRREHWRLFSSAVGSLLCTEDSALDKEPTTVPELRSASMELNHG